MNKKQLFFTMVTTLVLGYAIYDPAGFMGAAAVVMMAIVGVVITVSLIAVFSQMYISLGNS